MDKMEIDYSELPKPVTVTENEDWEPPVHKYFGPKGPKGKPLPEPVYVHQEYPRTVYGQRNGKIVAKLVSSDREFHALGKGWEKNPSAFGFIGAPSAEQVLEMSREAEDARQLAAMEAEEAAKTSGDIAAKKKAA